jgi:Tropinone reductase 1
VGTSIVKPTPNVTAQDFSFIMGTNIESAYHLSQLAYPLLKGSGGGSIVLLSSISGLLSIGGASLYGASKGMSCVYIYIYIYIQFYGVGRVWIHYLRL